MPRCVDELLDRELVASPLSIEGISSPPTVEGKVVEGRSVAVMDAYPEPSEVDNLPTLEIQLHIAINIVYRLNAAEEARSLSVQELSLREFLCLQELLEPSLVPHIIDELLGRELVAPPPLTVVIPSPPSVEGRAVEGRSVAVYAHDPPSVGASVMVVHEPTDAHVLLPPSQVSVTRSSSVQVAMTQCIRYAMCHGNVVISFKVRPLEFAALEFGPVVPV
jgi:hypothetical protein